MTTHNERSNAVVTFGYKRDGHSIKYSNILLQDNEIETDFGLLESPAGSSTFSIVADGQANRTHEFIYEERQLNISQFVGQHTFMDLMGLGFDWQYTARKQRQTFQSMHRSVSVIALMTGNMQAPSSP